MKFDVVVIGGGPSGYKEAIKALGDMHTCAIVSEGRSLDKVDYHAFVDCGGILMLGDHIDKVNGHRAVTSNGVRLEAKEFILATGRFFSKGLICDMDTVREPVFGLDLDFPQDRSDWFNYDFFSDQKFEDFGVVLRDGHPMINGQPLMYVKAVGSILSKAYRDAE